MFKKIPKYKKKIALQSVPSRSVGAALLVQCAGIGFHNFEQSARTMRRHFL